MSGKRNGQGPNNNNNNNNNKGKNGKKGGNKPGNGDGSGSGKSCGNFMDQSSFEALKDGSERLQASLEAKKWYEFFKSSIPKQDIQLLRATADKTRISWDVTSVVAQLEQLYARVERYAMQADEQIKKLQSQGATSLFNASMFADDSGAPITNLDDSNLLQALFVEDKLLFGSVRLSSKIKSAYPKIVNAGVLAAKTTHEVLSEPRVLTYHPIFNCFFMYFTTAEVGSDMVRIAVRFSISGDVADIAGFDASSIPAGLDQKIISYELAGIIKNVEVPSVI